MATYDPHLQRAFDGESRERSSELPRAMPGAREASSGTTGRGEGADAADGRTAAQESVGGRSALLQAALAEVARLTRERDEARAERDRFEAVIGRVEYVVEDFVACTCEHCEALRGAVPRLRRALDEDGR